MIRYSDYPMGVFEGYGEDPSPNGNDVDAEIAREELDDHIFLKDLVSELSPHFPITQRFDCTSCDDKGCGFCVTGDSLAAYFPNE